MSPLVIDFIKSAALPGLIVAVLFFIVGGRKDPFRARLQALVWALSFCLGAYVLIGRIGFPPYDVNEGFSWCALALAVFVLVSPQAVGSRYLVRALFVLALGFLTLWPIHSTLTAGFHLRNLLAFFCLGLGVWSIMERAAHTVQPLTYIALPLISATALSLLMMFKGSASFAQILSVVCTLLGAVLVLAWWSPRRVSVTGMIPFVSVFIITFMAAGHFYLDINPWFMIYLSVPFFVLWVRRVIPFLPRHPLAEVTVMGLIAGIPVGYFIWTIYQAAGPLY